MFKHPAITRCLRCWRNGIQRLRCWRQRARQRRALARLDDHLLRDIGLTREQAGHEAKKPFWR